jgi:hypothetical protein
MSDLDTPEGFYPIDGYTNGREIVILGFPPQDDELPEGAQGHSCDEMGCGSVGPHVVAIIDLPEEVPQLAWAKPYDWKMARVSELREGCEEALAHFRAHFRGEWEAVGRHPASRWLKDIEYFEGILKK